MAEEVGTITSAEELDALLDAQGAVETGTDGNPVVKPGGKDKAPTAPAKGADDKGQAQEGKDDLPGDEEEEETEEGKDGDDDKVENYGNVVEYLNKKHNLGLNIAELPKDLTREDEAEIVEGLFERVVQGADARIRQYEEVQTLLKDDEVVALLKAKSEGKGLKDLFSQFVTTPEGMSNEQLVFDDFKKKYPKLADTAINNMIATQKEKGQFEEVATAIREQRKEDDTKSAQQRVQEEQTRVTQEKQAREQEDLIFTDLVKKVNKINGVAFTQDMKDEVLSYALKRDNTGMSELDKALQSDVGVLRAALGVFALERLMGAKSTVKVNKTNMTLMDKLFKKPGEAASKGGNAQHTEEIPDEVFNRF